MYNNEKKNLKELLFVCLLLSNLKYLYISHVTYMKLAGKEGNNRYIMHR